MALATEQAHRLADAAQALRGATRVTAICHENPDADTVAAAIAIGLIAERLGAQSEIVSVDPLPPSMALLPRIDQVRRAPQLAPDLAVVCDAATMDRVGAVTTRHADWLARCRVLNIDHHATNSMFGQLNLVDPSAAATCQVVLELVDELGLTVDADLATALLTGIVRDTNGFSDRSTSAGTLRAVARLIDAGAPLPAIYRQVLSELPVETMALWGRMLADVGRTRDGRVIYATLTQRMLAETGTRLHDGDGVAEFLARAKGSDVILLLREVGPSETRVSIRTSDVVDASTIAGRLGGGGHSQRAGCTLALPSDQARERVLDAVRAVLSS